jgi:hypothetical protein
MKSNKRANEGMRNLEEGDRETKSERARLRMRAGSLLIQHP